MNNKQDRYNQLITNLSYIKELIVSHDQGELYITWKGSAFQVKFSHIVQKVLTANNKKNIIET